MVNSHDSQNNEITGLMEADADLSSEQQSPKRPIWEIIVEIGKQIPDEEWAKIPDDVSINYKHYLYGAPKKSA